VLRSVGYACAKCLVLVQAGVEGLNAFENPVTTIEASA